MKKQAESCEECGKRADIKRHYSWWCWSCADIAANAYEIADMIAVREGTERPLETW